MLAILLALALAPPSATSPDLVAPPPTLQHATRALVEPPRPAPPASPAGAVVVGFSGGSDLGRMRRLEPPHEQKTVVVTLGVRF